MISAKNETNRSKSGLMKAVYKVKVQFGGNLPQRRKGAKCISRKGARTQSKLPHIHSCLSVVQTKVVIDKNRCPFLCTLAPLRAKKPFYSLPLSLCACLPDRRGEKSLSILSYSFLNSSQINSRLKFSATKARAAIAYRFLNASSASNDLIPSASAAIFFGGTTIPVLLWLIISLQPLISETMHGTCSKLACITTLGNPSR